jgi:putative polyhydroxyalkanoate system protein
MIAAPVAVYVLRMSEIVVRGRHELGLARAKRLAEAMALRLRDDYGGTYAWAGDRLQFDRTGASGRITVKPDAFEVRVEIGFLLSPLRGRIEREIRAFCDQQFGVAGADRDQPARPAVRSAGTRSSRSQGASRSVRPK